MPLNSPRFKNEKKFQQIASGQSVFQNGSKGREVHLMQMALVDIGIAMPISTKSSHYSPDGIYGAETVAAVKTFQQQEGLKDDGIFGAKSLEALDKKHPAFTHRVSLHFRSLTLTDVPFQKIMSSLETVYAQYSIEAFFASGMSLGLSDDEAKRFSVVKQDCNWDMDSGEFAELHQLGTPVPKNDIGVFFVNAFQEIDVLGCGGHAKAKPACAVTHNCSRWDPAHEVGHVLLTSVFAPVHSGDKRNLMFAFSSNGPVPLTLTDKQLKAMRASPLCKNI